MNVKRGKIFLGQDNLIDLTHPVNKSFINYHVASGKKFDINNIYIKRNNRKITGK
jgi:hypothetical protein